MGSLSAVSGFNMDSFIANSSINEFFVWAWPIIAGSSTSNFSWEDDHQYPILDLKITGSFEFHRDDGWPSGGTITGLSFSEDGVTQFSVSGVSITVDQLYSFADTDDLYGLFQALLAGNDTVSGTSGNETLHAFDGNDVMFGNAGNDTLYGDSGNDLIIGGTGNDHIEGGLGADLLSEGSSPSGIYGDDLYDGGAGTDEVLYSATGPGITLDLSRTAAQETGQGSDTFISVENVKATSGNDHVTGTDSTNWIVTFGGNDIVSAAGGDDLISLSAGDKIIDGGTGIDGLEISDLGSDTGQASVTISLLLQGVAQDTGMGQFTLTSIENLSGSKFDDVLTGDANANVLIGSGGNDTLAGGKGDDRLLGDGYYWISADGSISVVPNVESGASTTVVSGNDALEGGAGNDFIDGGAGIDTASYIHDGAVTVNLSLTGAQNTVGAGLDTVLNVENLIGSGYADKLTGNALANTLWAGTGDDVLSGMAGNDTLDGGGGNDKMLGGTGDDTYIVSQAGDAEYENAGEGTDLVLASVSTALRANIENLTLTGAASLSGKGNELGNAVTGNDAGNALYGYAGDDTLTGNGGRDVLDGGAGNDTLKGGADNDVYVIDSSSDLIVENAGEGVDFVQTSASYTLSANVDRMYLLGSEDIDGTGNDLANLLVGNSGANTLSGLGANDRIYGAAGSDLIDGGDGNDYMEGGAGQDDLIGGSGRDYFVFRDGDFGGATIATGDRIEDFAYGDRISLSPVDANASIAGNQAFAFIGTASFDGTAGELRYEQVSGNTYVSGDTNGDGIADFMIKLDGVHTLSGSDFGL